MLNTRAQISTALSNAVSYATANQYGIVDISPATIKWMQYGVIRLIDYGGEMDLTAVNAQHIDDWLSYEAARDVSPHTVNSYLRAVKTLYSRLIRNGIANTNPAATLKPYPTPPPSPKAISQADYHALLTAVSNPRDKAIIATFWATGCRVGGLLSMRIDKIERWDKNGGVQFALYVTEKGRNGKSKPRWCYSKGDEARILDTWLRVRPSNQTPNIFTTYTKKTRPMKQTAVSSIFRKARIRAGLFDKPSSPHSFRHAFAIRHLNDGRDIAIVSQWLGHHSPEFTASVYAIRSESELRSAYFSVERA